MSSDKAPSVEWNALVKPILAASYGSFNKNDLFEFIHSISLCETSLLDHPGEYETFYSPFVLLAADYITQNIAAVSECQLWSVCDAARILGTYILRCVAVMSRDTLTAAGGNSVVSRTQLLHGLRVLCVGGALDHADNVTLVATMKTANLPLNIRTAALPKDAASATSRASSNVAAAPCSSRARQSGTDQLCQLLSRPVLQARADSDNTAGTAGERASSCSASSGSQPVIGSIEHIKRVYHERTTAALALAGAADTLLSMCLSLPQLSRYFSCWSGSADCSTRFCDTAASLLPGSLKDAINVRASLSSLCADMSTVRLAVSLPLLDSVPTACLQAALRSVSGGCLMAATTVAAAAAIVTPAPPSSPGASDDQPEHVDPNASELVQLAVDVGEWATAAAQSHSTAAYLEMQRDTCVVLFSAVLSFMHSVTSMAERHERTRSPLKSSPHATINLQKVQENVNVLLVTLVERALTALSNLLSHCDQSVPTCVSADAAQTCCRHIAVDTLLSSSQHDSTLTELLVLVAVSCYRRAASVHAARTLHASRCHAPTRSDCQADRTAALDSDSDGGNDDSILGEWMNRALYPRANECARQSTPPASVQMRQLGARTSPQRLQHSSVHHPVLTSHRARPLSKHKRIDVFSQEDPRTYISVACHVMRVLARDLVDCGHACVTHLLRRTITEHQVLLLAAMLRDIETGEQMYGSGAGALSASSEQSAVDSDGAAYHPACWYGEIGAELSRLLHNWTAGRLLSVTHQQLLLQQLGVDATATSHTPPHWPLYVPCRSLRVLAQQLLMSCVEEARDDEQERTEGRQGGLIVAVWTRLLHTLVNRATSNSTTVSSQTAVDDPVVPSQVDHDFNYEHAQLLLLLFHTLKLMDKKAVFHLCQTAVVQTAASLSADSSTNQMLCLLRILVLFEYIVHNLYEPPGYLVDQVRRNVLNDSTVLKDSGSSSAAFIAFSHAHDSSAHQRGSTTVYYRLTQTFGDALRVDGLASSFLLSSGDGCTYDELYSSVVQLLNVVEYCTMNACSHRAEYSVCVRHCASLVWSLCMSLPPSAGFMRRSVCEDELAERAQWRSHRPCQLVTMLWLARCQQKTFTRLIKDGLVKQGVDKSEADRLLDMGGRQAGDVAALVRQLRLMAASLQHETDTAPRHRPSFGQLLVLHCLLAALQCEMTNAARDLAMTPLSSLAVTPNSDNVVVISAASTESEQCDDATVHATSDSCTSVEDDNRSCHRILHVLTELIHSVAYHLRWSVLLGGDGESVGGGDAAVHYHLLQLMSSRCVSHVTLAEMCATHTPLPALLERFNESICRHHSPPARSNSSDNSGSAASNWLSSQDSTCMDVLVSGHMTHLLAARENDTTHCTSALLRVLRSLVQLSHSLYSENIFDEAVVSGVSGALTSLALDACCQSAVTDCQLLDVIVGAADSDRFIHNCYAVGVRRAYDILRLITFQHIDVSGVIGEECVQFLDSMLSTKAGRQTLVNTNSSAPAPQSSLMLTVLMSAGAASVSVAHAVYVLKFFRELFNTVEEHGCDELCVLCTSLECVADLGDEELQRWLGRLVRALSQHPVSSPGVSRGHITAQLTTDSCSDTLDSQQLLHDITAYLVKPDSLVSRSVPASLLSALIVVANEVFVSGAAHVGVTHAALVTTMAQLATVTTSSLQLALFSASVKWLAVCETYLSQEDVLERVASFSSTTEANTTVSHAHVVQLTLALLDYVTDMLAALRISGDTCRPCVTTAGGHLTCTTAASGVDSEIIADLDCDWIDDMVVEDSDCDDSDEDSLNNKLCTFSSTQREYMIQHWYHCHTCGMLDSVGCCSVCVRVCHRGHDVTYAKYGSFFCDCGARDDGSCSALVRRSSHQPRPVPSSCVASTSAGSGSMDRHHSVRASAPTAASSDSMLHSLLRRRASNTAASSTQQTSSGAGPVDSTAGDDVLWRRRQLLAAQLRPARDQLVQLVASSGVYNLLVRLASRVLPVCQQTAAKVSAVGAQKRVAVTLQRLHDASGSHIVANTDNLATLISGCEESVFDSVRMSFTGEQGQTIRQLLSAHMIRRMTMCCLTASASNNNKRQLLAVCHEKGKIAMLQLSSVLKQAGDGSGAANRRKNVARVSSATLPFTVITITDNPCNCNVLAVCGPKDCHVLTLNSSAAVSEHLVLQPQLETGNFVIKAIWQPGSQASLALVTADFVKLYQLDVDILSPSHYFLLPSGKIRDACMANMQSGGDNVLVMSSTGLIYYVRVNDTSSASHGPFYVTNILDVHHADIKWSNDHICGGGVSIYYSHMLQMLFFSFAQGKSFFAPLGKQIPSIVDRVQQISLKSLGSGKPNWQPLCQWSEVLGHAGLLSAVTQSSCSPVLLMLRADGVSVHELRLPAAKCKVTDVVLARHSVSVAAPQLSTVLIVLCEDGTVRPYAVNQDTTDFWFSRSLNPVSVMSLLAHRKKPGHKSSASAAVAGSGRGCSPQHVISPDFFESCVLMSDVEFGGADVLQVYNVQQLKHRLHTNGLYIASTQPEGFTLEVSNTNTSMVMCGVRVMVGAQDPQQAPAYLEVFDRNITLTCTRWRWFDVAFSRDESVKADRHLKLKFAASHGPGRATLLDSVKVYGKTKESFGWPEELDESTNTVGATVTASTELPSGGGSGNYSDVSLMLDRVMCSCLECVEHYVSCDGEDGVGSAAAGASSVNSSADSRQMQLQYCRSSLQQLCVDATQLSVPVSPRVAQHAESLLVMLHPSTSAYHCYKDQYRMKQMWAVLNALESASASISDNGNAGADYTHPLPDTELFHQLLINCRSLALTRPSSFVRLIGSTTGEPGSGGVEAFVTRVLSLFWHLLRVRPANEHTCSVCVPGLTHVESCVACICDILYVLLLWGNAASSASLVTDSMCSLLLCPCRSVSFSTKHALTRLLRPKSRRRHRRVFIPSPPSSLAPVVTTTASDVPATSMVAGSAEAVIGEEGAAASESVDVDVEQDVGDDDMVIDSLLAQARGLPLNLSTDADDETMMELAIALSLQQPQQQSDSAAASMHSLHEHLHNVSHLEPSLGNLLEVATSQSSVVGNVGHQSAVSVSQQPVERQMSSDSSSGSSDVGVDDEDDERSTAATDGSTLRTSPAEAAGSGGSESGASGADSVAGDHLSARSSIYGDGAHDASTTAATARSETSSLGAPTSLFQPLFCADDGDDSERQLVSSRLHVLRVDLLERLVGHVPQACQLSGVQAVPFFQMVLMLCAELETGSDGADDQCLQTLLSTLLQHISMQCGERRRDVTIIIMRLFSVLMSRCRSAVQQQQATETGCDASSCTARALLRADMPAQCLTVLQSLLPYWRQCDVTDEATVVASGKLLNTHHMHGPLPDMSPFFLKEYVKRYGLNVFSAFPQLMTELCLRVPYQVKKLTSCVAGSGSVVVLSPVTAWQDILCQFMIYTLTPFVRRQVRKLLLDICGSKEHYRYIRDVHLLRTHIQAIRELCGHRQPAADMSGTSVASITASTEASTSQPNTVPPLCHTSTLYLSYNNLIDMVERLKACHEVAACRTVNWQSVCASDASVMRLLMDVSCRLADATDAVSSMMLQLVNLATSPPALSAGASAASSDEQSSHTAVCLQLIEMSRSTPHVVRRFIGSFLLDSGVAGTRWLCHALVLAVWRCLSARPADQLTLVELLWRLWPRVATQGSHGAQYVDLLGYVSLHTDDGWRVAGNHVERVVDTVRTHNQLLADHPNSQLYASLRQLVCFDGHYLESQPCLVCNTTDTASVQIKLSAAKVESRYTTTSQLVRLTGMHSISRISLRAADVKRSKMVRVISFFYSNRSVQSVVELKNRQSIWQRAKKISLSAGQTEAKLDFLLPIVACNLKIEYTSFYENMQSSSETLQCPRCSANVPAHPGVCGNCGENVYQCHKCRAINYDEKDPFLCNACGFCKYAKFEYTLTARACCAVDPVESEEDRGRAVTAVNTLLDQADKIYRSLMAHKPALESLVSSLLDGGSQGSSVLSQQQPASATDAADQPSATATSQAAGGNANHLIQQLSQRYCIECRQLFEELSGVIQRVTATRRQLLQYDCQTGVAAAATTAAVTNHATQHEDCMLPTRCYGCACAVSHCCVTVLRALASCSSLRATLCSHGLLTQLVEHNLKTTTATYRDEVVQLLCSLTRDNVAATLELNGIISERVTTALAANLPAAALFAAVGHEMALLQAAALRHDTCWEHRLRCVMSIFVKANKQQYSNSVVLEVVILPCIRVLQQLVQAPSSQAGAGVSCISERGGGLVANTAAWLHSDPRHSFSLWRQRAGSTATFSPDCQRGAFLQHKYALRWRRSVLVTRLTDNLLDVNWLRRSVLHVGSRAVRQMTADLTSTLVLSQPATRRAVLHMLTGFLSDVVDVGESSAEFLALYHQLIIGSKCHLASTGVLSLLGGLMTREIDNLLKLEQTTLNSDLSQGYALRELTEVMCSLLDMPSVRHKYKTHLLSTILHGYLSLRRLVIQRTKLVDLTQQRLLQLIEDIISGGEAETRQFMTICVDSLANCPLSDIRTPQFVFERLCSIIKPEVNDLGPFLLSLEKEPQQEDFLQGRMVGNPYSSNDAGMGPLMRHVKNRICTDCELVALLDDDTGMELLVNGRIISLDLPVKEVYQKVWLPCSASEGEPMRVVYRMRGLLGDATEEFVENLAGGSSAGASSTDDDEHVYRLANVLSECDGVRELLRRLEHVNDLRRDGPLLLVLLRLMWLCLKTRVNRISLLSVELRAISIMLQLLSRSLEQQQQHGSCSAGVAGACEGGQSVTEQLLSVMRVLLGEAVSLPPSQHHHFAATCCSTHDIQMLLDYVTASQKRSCSGAGVLSLVLSVLPALASGCDNKMNMLVAYFAPPWRHLDQLDESTGDVAVKLECLCTVSAAIDASSLGARLKQRLIDAGVLQHALDYLRRHAPPPHTAAVAASAQQWRRFVQRPALCHVLRVLAGLSCEHVATQLALADDSVIAVIHRLEQASSDQHVGTLAENLLETLRTNEQVSCKIEEVRRRTRQEKKRLAMAMRQQQLGALGMRANDKGQVVASGAALRHIREAAVGGGSGNAIDDETGLTCNICREGYRCQPTKVLAIYTFSKRCVLDEEDGRRPRRTVGYSTVSHFNLVHVDCHMAAVRQARARDEWDSAALQNGNTRCNGLLPVWGPRVAESSFAHCLARHNTYLQESTGHRDIGYHSAVHDFKMLLLRLAHERSLSVDSGGGGPQSNMCLLPYLAHVALYVMNTSRVTEQQAAGVRRHLVEPSGCDNDVGWLQTSVDVDGALYWCAMAPLVSDIVEWKRQLRVSALRRLLVLAHVRHHATAGGDGMPSDRSLAPFSVYRPYMVFFGLIDAMFSRLLGAVGGHDNEAEDARSTAVAWSVRVADYIRHHDQQVLEQCEVLLHHYQCSLLPATSLQQLLNVLNVLPLSDTADALQFVSDTLQLPQ